MGFTLCADCTFHSIFVFKPEFIDLKAVNTALTYYYPDVAKLLANCCLFTNPANTKKYITRHLDLGPIFNLLLAGFWSPPTTGAISAF